MKKFTIKPLVLAMSVVALPMTGYAQDEQSENVEEIVVTGSFRDSLQNSMNIKRNESGFVDAVVASDIAEFPDNNLAESLQRIPGVAIQRSGGEGRGITVRGLGPTFTTVRLNGMETISTTGGTDAVGGNNRGRGFDFNTFSSDLFSSLTVYKTNAAERPEGSLGATVDMKAAQPFDYDDFVLTASGNLGYNDLSKESDPSASFLVSNVFADGKFGALLSFSYSERSVQDEGASTVRWSNASGESFGQYQGAAITATSEINTAFHPRIPRYDSYEHSMERMGTSLSLQFRPTDTTEISLDGLWATFDATRQETFMQGSLNGSQNAGVNVLDYEIQGNTLVYADLQGARLLSETRFDDMTTDFSQITLSLKQDFSDSFRMKAMIGTTQSDYDNPIQNTVLMQADNQRFTYDFRDYDNPKLTFGDSAYDSSTWAATGIRHRPQSTINENDSGQVSFEYDLSDQMTLKFGADVKDFSFSTDQYAYASEGANGVDIQSNPNFIEEFDSGLGDGQPWLIANRSLVMDSYNLFDLTLNPNYGNTYEVGEETTGAFVQLDFNFELASMPVRGDIGVRRFDTDQSSSGWLNSSSPSRQYITVDHSYSDTLPAVNLSIEPVEDFLVRASYSEGISRAGLGSIVPAVNVSVAGTSRTISGANPLLEPTKAKGYDFGAEWYFAEGGLVALTLFKKEIKSHVQTIRTTVNYADTGLPAEAAIAACTAAAADPAVCNATGEWDYSTPVNGPGGDLDGYEFSYQQQFTFLPGFLSDFGFTGSYAQVDSDMDYLATDGTVSATKPLVNLSDETYSGTLYYENDTFSGRVSVVHRSGYLTTPVGRNGNAEEGTNGTTNVDATFGYQFNEHLKFTFDALNLTDEVDDQWVGSQSDQRLSYYHSTGRQYYLGVQYKY